MEATFTITLILFIVIGIHTHFSFSIGEKGTDLEIYFEKSGDCPTNDMVSSFLDDVCEKDCFLDINCPGVEKCCQNGCGGTHCQIPSQYVDQCEGFSCDGQGEICVVIDDQPSCVCQSNCTDDDAERVCADDGQVYTSRCWLDVAACEQDIRINKTSCAERQEPPTEDGVPSMLFEATVFTADEYQDVTLYCDAASESPVSYAWIVTQPGVNMAVLLPGHSLDNLRASYDGKVLFITAVRSEDGGSYGCLASNLHGLSTVNHKLIVNDQENPTTQLLTTMAPRDQELVARPDSNQNSGTHELAPPNEACVQTLHRGRCFRQEVRWFYNMQSQRCEPFMYGGCGGNSNRFGTYEECSRACPNLPVDPCNHPIATGQCRAMIRRWAYEEDTGECIPFVYGGCGANGNNFRTRDECGYTCQDRPDKKINCECVRSKLKSSYCRNDFVITGRIRQEISSPVNGALLVIELETVFKIPASFPIRLGSQTNNITMVRDMSRSPRGCHCLSFTSDESFIFMGRMSEHGEAIIDDNCYVSHSNGKRRARMNTSIRCSGDVEHTVPGPRQMADEGVIPERMSHHDHVEHQIVASPVYRKAKKLSRRLKKKKFA